jgi:integrase
MYRRPDTQYWYITVGGVRKSSKYKSRAKAKQLEHKLNTEAVDARWGLSVITWERAALKWTKDFPKESSRYENIKHAEWWLERLKGRLLPQINRELIHKIVSTQLLDPNKCPVDLNRRIKHNSTANNYVGFVKRVIQYTSNINPKFIRYPAIKFPDYCPTPEDWMLIREELTPDELDVLEFTLAGGFRESNSMFYEWEWDHKTYCQIPDRDTKTDKPYGLPLNKTQQAIVARRRKMRVRHVKYVFTDAGEPWYANKLIRAIKRACKAAKVRVVTPHRLRHSFASWLAQRGVAKEIRARLMGHSVKDTQDIYSHFDVESLRPYANIIDTVLSQSGKKKRQHAG